MRIRVPTGPATPSAEERALHEASRHVPDRNWYPMVHCGASGGQAAFEGQQPKADEAVPRIEFDFADLGREEDQVLPSPFLNCSTKAFSEYLVDATLAFVESTWTQRGNAALRPRTCVGTAVEGCTEQTSQANAGETWPESHQNQGKIENANRLFFGVCRAMWLSLENLLQEKLPSDSILVAWLIRDAAWSLTRFQVKNDGRTAFVLFGRKAYTSQVLPFRERVMYKYTALPTGNLDQRWSHGIWVVKAPMTGDHIIVTENGVQKARSLHRVPLEERFVISQ